MNASTFTAKAAAGALVFVMAGALAPQPASAYQCKNFAVTGANSITHHKAGNKIWAQRTAIAGWSKTVKANQGLAWSMWSIAKSKSVRCKKVGSSWACKAVGLPCKYAVQ